MNTKYDKRLQHPFTSQLCGATSSGKVGWLVYDWLAAG